MQAPVSTFPLVPRHRGAALWFQLNQLARPTQQIVCGPTSAAQDFKRSPSSESNKRRMIAPSPSMPIHRKTRRTKTRSNAAPLFSNTLSHELFPFLSFSSPISVLEVLLSYSAVFHILVSSPPNQTRPPPCLHSRTCSNRRTNRWQLFR